MICVNRKDRYSGKQALDHPWFKKFGTEAGETGEDFVLDPNVVKSLRAFRGQSKLKKAALNVLIKMVNPKEIEDLRKEFQKIDTDHSGFIEVQELETALKNSNFEMTAKELKSIVDELDYAGNQRINYSEFLAATISINTFLTDEKLWALFRQFDVDNTNEITVDNIKEAMSKLGKDITDAELEEIMKKHDVSGDRAISFEEFKEMMTGI